jgi:hypothetical protein
MSMFETAPELKFPLARHRLLSHRWCKSLANMFGSHELDECIVWFESSRQEFSEAELYFYFTGKADDPSDIFETFFEQGGILSIL